MSLLFSTVVLVFLVFNQFVISLVLSYILISIIWSVHQFESHPVLTSWNLLKEDKEDEQLKEGLLHLQFSQLLINYYPFSTLIKIKTWFEQYINLIYIVVVISVLHKLKLTLVVEVVVLNQGTESSPIQIRWRLLSPLLPKDEIQKVLVFLVFTALQSFWPHLCVSSTVTMLFLISLREKVQDKIYYQYKNVLPAVNITLWSNTANNFILLAERMIENNPASSTQNIDRKKYCQAQP